MNNTGVRAYAAGFTVTAGQANTDTVQTLVVPGDTAGTWLTDTDIGLGLGIIVAAASNLQGPAGWNGLVAVTGQTNGMATAGNVFELFDVGLYIDPDLTGTPPRFEMPDEAAERLACQRYWWAFNLHAISYAEGAGRYHGGPIVYPTPMRIVPTLAQTAAGTASNCGGATIDTARIDGCRWYLYPTAAGPYYVDDRIFSLNARM